MKDSLTLATAALTGLLMATAPGCGRDGAAPAAAPQAQPPDRATPRPPTTPPPKRLLTRIRQPWVVEPDPNDERVPPISDEAWPAHPCRRLAELVVGSEQGSAEQARALWRQIEADHLRDDMVPMVTTTYATCRAIEADDPARCEVPQMSQEEGASCRDFMISWRLTTPYATPAACEAAVTPLGEGEATRSALRVICRALSQGPEACRDFPDKDNPWVCLMHATRDIAACAAISDPSLKGDCLGAVELLRARAGLPPQTDRGPDDKIPMPLRVLNRLVKEPDLDCAAWYRAELRAHCR